MCIPIEDFFYCTQFGAKLFFKVLKSTRKALTTEENEWGGIHFFYKSRVKCRCSFCKYTELDSLPDHDRLRYRCGGREIGAAGGRSVRREGDRCGGREIGAAGGRSVRGEGDRCGGREIGAAGGRSVRRKGDRCGGREIGAAGGRSVRGEGDRCGGREIGN